MSGGITSIREGPWLDDLEKTLVDDASNIWAEGLPLDAELRALDSGRVLIGAIIGALRHQLRGARPS
jgi:hypothetical protein